MMNRREFLQFMGRSAALTAAGPLLTSYLLSACSSKKLRKKAAPDGPHVRAQLWPFAAIGPQIKDEISVPSSFHQQVLIQSGDSIGPGMTLGSYCDYTAFFPIQENNWDDGILWINHEHVSPLFHSRRHIRPGEKRVREEVLSEQNEVGGTLVRIKRNPETREWKVVVGDAYNRRFTARTPIPFSSGLSIAGSTQAIGTLANCAGGVTPWGSVLTCEENYDEFFGERSYSRNSRITPINTAACALGWETVESRPPEHYGWVVEINTKTGVAKKLVSLGRFAHECAKVTQAKDGRCVVYMGDDDINRCLYKFISDKKGSLDSGQLYVAQLETGRWLPMNWATQPRLKSWFQQPTDVLVYAREAATLLGGTPLHRPEGIEIDPQTHAVLISLTNHEKKGDLFGSILKIEEKDANPLSLEFSHSVFLAGGEATGFACPDNLAFDPAGDLWFTCDVSGYKINRAPYTSFGNNSLFCVPMSGPDAGKAFRFASGPMEAELTGPCFTPDGETLFLSVQHPGEVSKDFSSLTSHWPNGENSIPRSAVLAIQ